ncbi:MAG: hypothetical protein JWQ07_1015 [Ramlibacter sp.]|nr:hypothetical protein [Ramlibacter sp.]
MTHPQTPGRAPLILALCALALGLCTLPAMAAPAWLMGDGVKGNGIVRKQARELGPFTGVSLSLPAEVEVRLGNTEGVSIETDENLLALVETVVENGTLEIRPARRNTSLEPRTLKIVVQAKLVNRLSLGGSGSIRADSLRAPGLKLEVGGSGSIDIKSAECESLSAAMGGSGSVKLAGSARKLSVSIGGSGGLQAGQLKADDVDVSIGGSGQATVWAREKLSVVIAGSGEVNYYGDPKVRTSVVGSGGAKRLGPAPR